MHDQHVARRELREQIFAAPPERLDGLAFELLGEVRGQRPAQVAAPRLDLLEARAFHDRLQAAADGFDLGKFRHGGAAAHELTLFPCGRALS